MYKSLLNRYEFLCKEIEKCRNAIKYAPPGKLEIYKNRSNTKWYVKPDIGEARYISKSEDKLASELALKRVETERLKLYEKELHALELFLNHVPTQEQIFKSTELQTKFSSLVLPGKQIKTSWADDPFASNPAFPENLKHKSPSKHLLRSKSECLIDMQLFYRKIPFRYENQLIIDGQVHYPDFTFYKESTGEFRYWEHFGMMDDPKYRKRALEKEEFYYSHDFFPCENIYFTYETSDSPITIPTIDKIIDDIEEWLS
ncbi:MAG: hypothetical protein IK121_05565 [Lachnospiraceae bacterium]|nr:hypothetical protein [Lachnospiraceae bacterium]